MYWGMSVVDVLTCIVVTQAVDELLAALGASGEQRVPVPAWHYEEAAEAHARQDGCMPLGEALQKCYDLRCTIISASDPTF